MRMAGPDIVLFVVGALLFGGASYAIVQQGGLEALREQTSTLGQFTVTFEAHRHDHEPIALASLRSVEQTFDVNETDVSTVYFLVTCTDGQAANLASFRMEINVKAPGNITPVATNAACGDTVEIPVKVAPVPRTTTVQAETESEARERLQPDANATAAFGTWTVTIAGARNAGGVGLPGQVTQGDPSGSIAIGMDRWQPTFTAVQAR